jgi:hypothetical protein
MNFIDKFYFSYKNDKYIKSKSIIICVLLIIIIYVVWNELNYENCYVPINITKDSIMRLIPEPQFLVPPPFINFCNQ